MSTRTYDIIVFGATGRVGRAVSKLLHYKYPCRKWAIMARAHAKLSTLIAELNDRQFGHDLPDVLVADAQDFRYLRDIFSEATLVINCIRPYSLGKDIIEACIMAKCNYMDTCPEIYFIESNFAEFHAEAEKKKVRIIHGCGFECLCSDLNLIYAIKNFAPDECNSVESFLTVLGNSHADCSENHIRQPLHNVDVEMQNETFETTITNLKQTNALRRLRAKSNTAFNIPPIRHPGPRIQRKSAHYYDRRINRFAMPTFNTDTEMVRHTIRTLSLQTGDAIWPQFNSYITMESYMAAAHAAFTRAMFQSFASSSLGRTILRSFPEMFTNGYMRASDDANASSTTNVVSSSSGSNESLTASALEALHANPSLQPSFSVQTIARGYLSLDELDMEDITGAGNDMLDYSGPIDEKRRVAGTTEPGCVENIKQSSIQSPPISATAVVATARGGGGSGEGDDNATADGAISVEAADAGDCDPPLTAATAANDEAVADMNRKALLRKEAILAKLTNKTFSASNKNSRSKKALVHTNHKKTQHRRPGSTVARPDELNQTAVEFPTCNNLLGFGAANKDDVDKYNTDVADKIAVEMRTLVTGPDPYEKATPLVCVVFAHCILDVIRGLSAEYSSSSLPDSLSAHKEDTLPVGGVFTAGSAFYNCNSIYDRLCAAGIVFKVLSNDMEVGNDSTSTQELADAKMQADIVNRYYARKEEQPLGTDQETVANTIVAVEEGTTGNVDTPACEDSPALL